MIYHLLNCIYRFKTLALLKTRIVLSTSVTQTKSKHLSQLNIRSPCWRQ